MQKQVMIVEQDRELVRRLSHLCRQLGVEPFELADPVDAIRAVAPSWDGAVPDLCIVNESSDERDPCVCESLVAQQVWMPIPVIALTEEGDQEAIARCDCLGVCRVSKSPTMIEELRPLICQLLDLHVPAVTESGTGSRASAVFADTESMPRVLCIDDDDAFVLVTVKRLWQFGIEVVGASSGIEGFWKTLKYRPDAVLTDYAMPEGYATYLIRRLKEHSLTKHIPVFVATGRNAAGRATGWKDTALERQLLGQGAECVLSKPVDFDRLIDELRRHPSFQKVPGPSCQVC